MRTTPTLSEEGSGWSTIGGTQGVKAVSGISGGALGKSSCLTYWTAASGTDGESVLAYSTSATDYILLNARH